MGAKKILRSVLISTAFCGFTLLFSTCGGGREPTFQPGATDDLVGGKDTPETDLIQQRLDTDVIQGGNGKSVSLVDVLRELEDMPAPANVDADIFAQLKSALVEELSINEYAGLTSPAPDADWSVRATPVKKFVSTPPTGDAYLVEDLTADDVEGTITLRWTYKNPGDYTQDGIVNVQEISALAEHFNEAITDSGWEHPVDAVIDGDGNGVINIADVTPVAQNFWNQIVGYKVLASGEETGEYTEVRTVEVVKPPVGELLRFEELFTSEDLQEPYLFFKVAPFNQDGDGIPSAPVRLNLPPRAVLRAEPTLGGIPLRVTFDASESGDDSEITAFEWDFDGDGTYDLNSGTESVVQHLYEGTGVFLASVRVTDGSGLSATASVEITVTEPNEPPVAVLTADVTEGMAPLTVHFDAGGSSDPDGEIVFYEWSLSGGPNYEYAGGNLSTIERTYGEGGTYEVRLRVTDNLGLTDVATLPIRVNVLRGDWWMYGRDARHTGRSSLLGPEDPFEKWIHRLTGFGGSFASSPVLGGNGILYIPLTAGNLLAISPDGLKVWEAPLGVNIENRQTPAVGVDGTIYVAVDNRLMALDVDGQELWRYVLPGNEVAETSPAIGPEGTIFVGSVDVGGDADSLYALNPDGSLKWTYVIGSRPGNPAVALDGTIYIGANDRKLRAFNPDGTLKWEFEGVKHDSTPAIAEDGTIYVGAGGDNVYLFAISPEGQEIWKFPTDLFAGGTPTIGPDGTVYVASSIFSGSFLYALTPDGTLKWELKPAEQLQGVVGDLCVDSEGTIYFTTTMDGRLNAYSSEGTLKWYWNVGVGSGIGPVVGEGRTVYIAVGAELFALGDA